MKINPIRTDFFDPENQDFLDFLTKNLPSLKDKSVLFITSKLISLWQGRYVKRPEDFDGRERLKLDLVKKEADKIFAFIKGKRKTYAVTQKHYTFILNAGIDPFGKWFVLPIREPQETAKKLWKILRDKYSIKNLGVVFVDSKSEPLRRGLKGYSVGFWGILPFRRGTENDGRPLNIIDPLSSLSDIYMGKFSRERLIPLVIIEEIEDLVVFTGSSANFDFYIREPERDFFKNFR